MRASREPLPGGNKSRRVSSKKAFPFGPRAVCFSHTLTRAVSAEFLFSGQKIVRTQATFAALSPRSVVEMGRSLCAAGIVPALA